MLKKIGLVIAAILLVLMLGLVVFIWQFELDDYRQDVEVLLTE